MNIFEVNVSFDKKKRNISLFIESETQKEAKINAINVCEKITEKNGDLKVSYIHTTEKDENNKHFVSNQNGKKTFVENGDFYEFDIKEINPKYRKIFLRENKFHSEER